MPEISDGLYGLIGALIGAALTYLGVKRANATNLQIARDRLEAEYRLKNKALAAVGELLNHPEYPQRSFEQISRRVGGFQGDDLRQLLLEAGAVRFEQRGTGKELWGLRERNQDSSGADG